MKTKDVPIDNFGPFPAYWTQLVILHDWPPGWMPACDWGKSVLEQSQAATRGRETQLEHGYDGSIMGISKLADDAIAAYRGHAAKGKT